MNYQKIFEVRALKKFKYSRLSLICQIAVTLFSVYFIFHGMDLFTKGIKILNNIDIRAFLVFFVILFPFLGEYLNRFIEFYDEYVTFNSFRIRKTVRNYNIRYEDILRIDSKKIPLLGFYKIIVTAKNVPYSIPVTWCMKKHKKLFGELCVYAKKGNPKVNISKQLIEYYKKKGIL